MLFFTLTVIGVHCPKTLVGPFQHFVAGILMYTIRTEIPSVVDLVTGTWETMSSVFFVGVAAILALGSRSHPCFCSTWGW